MKRILLVLAVIGVACAGSLQAAPVSYVGKLACTSMGGSGDGSLFVTGLDWLSPNTTLSWQVDNTTTPGMWHYEYTIVTPSVPGPWSDIQRVIIETSDGSSGPAFTSDDLFSLTTSPTNWAQTVQVGTHRPADNLNLPRNVYGILLATASIDPETLTISFDTTRQPVWGDFYAMSFRTSGQFSAFYNWGLLGTPESDPSDPPSDGSIDDHVLVPDSQETVMMPAPGAMLLGALGTSLTGFLRRRRWL